VLKKIRGGNTAFLIVFGEGGVEKKLVDLVEGFVSMRLDAAHSDAVVKMQEHIPQVTKNHFHGGRRHGIALKPLLERKGRVAG